MAGTTVPGTTSSGATLRVEPADGLIDVERRIRLQGLLPHERVTVRSSTLRGADVTWRSHAVFEADAQGTIDLGRDTPLAGGSYEGVSAMGLLWSQTPDTEGSRELFGRDVTRPLATRIEALREGVAEPLQAVLTQSLCAPGVQRQEVREDGLVGTLFLPAGPGPHPAVVVLNGSGGGINEPRAALYASHGYAALALGYFKAPGLSDYISNTPLEYFKTGLDWVRRTQRPLHGFVAISGQSRGGELVLLLATLFPQDVSAVLAYVPGALVHGGQAAADPAVGRNGPAWLYRGQPLVHVWQNNRTATWEPYDTGPMPRRNERAIRTALQDPEAVARARIPVEKIQAPVLLLSATDDGSWPSSLYTQMVADKLAEVKHPHDVQRHDYADAGHSILFPYVPTTQLVYLHPVSGRSSTTGGTPANNAHADAHSWAAARRFLAAAVEAHAGAASQEPGSPA